MQCPPVMCQLCLVKVDIDIVSINQNVIDIAANRTQDHSPLPALTDANVF